MGWAAQFAKQKKLRLVKSILLVLLANFYGYRIYKNQQYLCVEQHVKLTVLKLCCTVLLKIISRLCFRLIRVCIMPSKSSYYCELQSPLIYHVHGTYWTQIKNIFDIQNANLTFRALLNKFTFMLTIIP